MGESKNLRRMSETPTTKRWIQPAAPIHFQLKMNPGFRTVAPGAQE
jgi:hypothetical protein